MSANVDVNPIIDAVPGRTVPGAIAGLGAGLAALGLVGLGYGFAVAGPAWTWGAFVVALVYTLAIAQGGVMFSVIQTATWGRWGRPFKRISETFFFVMPLAYLALLVFLVAGGLGIYSWNPGTILESGPVSLAPHSPEAITSKPYWLTTNFFMGRMVLGFGWLIVLDFFYIRASIGPDLLLAKQRLGDKAPGWWSFFIGGQTDVQKATEAGLRIQSILAPFIAISYAAVFTLMAMDLLMSLAPIWYSNMFPAWISVSSFWLSVAFLAWVTMLFRDWLHLGDVVKHNNTHDLGKMMMAGSMFWAYTTFSQILPIWYTNMPEETDYLMVRMYLPQWSWFAKLVVITCFLGPFTTLLSRGIKKMRWPLFAVATLILCGIFFERSLLVMPQIHMGDDFPMTNFLLCSVPMWLGAVGVILTVVSQFLARVPAVVVSDPNLQPHPWDVHVTSLDVQHH